MPDVSVEARELVRIVREDARLPVSARRIAGALAALAASNPDLALERLSSLRQQTLPRLPMHAPTVDYVRCFSVETFWRFNLAPDVKEAFVTHEDYRRYIESDADAGARLRADLGPQLIAPAANSWLLPSDHVEGLSGNEIKVRLNFDQPPPYVVMTCSVARMKATGVQVRLPTGLDAIPSRLIQWYAENVPDERIDGDIPMSALEMIEWRP